MPKSLQPRAGGTTARARRRSSALLPRDIVDEVRRATRPTQQDDVLVAARRARSSSWSATTPARGRPRRRRPRRWRRGRPASARCSGMAYYGVGRWQDAADRAQGVQAHDRARGPEPPDRRLPARARDGPRRPCRSRTRCCATAGPERGEGRGRDRGGVGARRPGALRRRRSRCLARAKTREDVAEDYTLRLWYVRGDILARAGQDARRPRASSARSCATTPAAFDAAERLARAAARRLGLALPALAPVPREALGVHPDRAERRRSGRARRPGEPASASNSSRRARETIAVERVVVGRRRRRPRAASRTSVGPRLDAARRLDRSAGRRRGRRRNAR